MFAEFVYDLLENPHKKTVDALKLSVDTQKAIGLSEIQSKCCNLKQQLLSNLLQFCLDKIDEQDFDPISRKMTGLKKIDVVSDGEKWGAIAFVGSKSAINLWQTSLGGHTKTISVNDKWQDLVAISKAMGMPIDQSPFEDLEKDLKNRIFRCTTS